MKFSFKIFIYSLLLIIISVNLGGFFIIKNTHENNLQKAISDAKENNKLLVTLYYNTINISDNNQVQTIYFTNILKNIIPNSKVYFINENDFKQTKKTSFVSNLSLNDQDYKIHRSDSSTAIIVISKVQGINEKIYIETITNITDIYNLRIKNYHTYIIYTVMISLISALILWFLSLHLTKPLKQLTKLTENFNQGKFSKTINISKSNNFSQEFLSLAVSYNKMTNKVNDYTDKLTEYGNRQEEFVSKFSHELKTPLTSIIGYADYLKTYKVEKDEFLEIANYISKEGKRLEDLSLHLLELNMLKKEQIKLSIVSSKKFFYEFNLSLKNLTKNYNVKLIEDIEEKNILIEPSLMKSLIYNLVDNACKSDTDTGLIIGKVKNKKYEITIKDYGKGIPKEDISKITEPFYMVDKSRARKQGGSGLGLSIVKEIANLHNSDLIIESNINKGTSIKIKLEVSNEK